MSIAVICGLILGLGAILCLSPWLWPKTSSAPRTHDDHGIKALLARAGMSHVSVPVFVFVSIITALGSAALTHALTGVAIVTLIASALALLVPYSALSARARHRRKATRALWPDVVDLILSGVRGGMGLPESLSALAHNGPAALRHEFLRFERDYSQSASFETSLDLLKERLADPAADRILETLRMARHVGGTELGTILRALSAHAREDSAIRHEVEARQSWVVGAARVGVVAPWIVLVLLSSRPEAAQAYNSPGGTFAIGVGLVITLVAYRIMLTIGRLAEEKRWFA